MKHFASLVFLLAVSVMATAQPYGDPKFKQKFNKADALVYDGSYMEALPLLEEMYASDSMNANLNHLLGIAYLMGKKDHALAIKRLESATRDVASPGNYAEGDWKEKKAPGITYYYLGKAYHFKNRFDRAVTNYYNYRSFIDLDDVETYNQVRQQIQYAENAMELVKNPVGVQVTNLGPEINTRYPEYCPVVSADGRVLIFTSRREGGTGGAVDDQGSFYEDIYVCQLQANGKWGKPQSIGSNINTAGHEAAIGLSPDGQLLFIYKDDNNNGNIYFSTLQGTDWSQPQPMGSDVNTTSWETHASVNATQDFLVFVSNRVGGYGGRDLWYCKKLPNGEWGLAQNMGSVVNTDFEEDSPFISSDGKTLIFSSMGHTSMGGFDIFRSELEDGVWTRPENIGYPINTSEDDVFFILTPDGRTAYYSSRKDGGFGETDLYKLKLEVKKADLLAVARGIMKVPAMDYADIKAKITVTDEGGAEIGTYRPSRATGVYVIVLPPGETYTITYHADGYPDVITKLPIGSGDVYADYEGPVELKEVVFGENILALQQEKERLEKEAQEAAAKAEQEKQLAAEAEAKAREDAERLALERAQEEEKRKAENAAAKETADAEQALKEQQEQARKAEVERKMAESKARYEAEQEAKRLADEKAKRDAEEAEQKLAEELAAAEEARLAEESSARKAAEAKEAEDRRLAEEAALKEVQREKEEAERLVAEEAAKEETELKAKQEEEDRRLTEEAALKQQQIEKEKAVQLAAQEEARRQEELKAQQEAENRAKQEEEQRMLAEVKRAEEEAARKVEEERIAAENKAEAERAIAEEAREMREKEEAEAAATKAEEARLAAAEQKRQDLQNRIEELKRQQEVQAEVAQNEPKEVKEVAVSNSSESASQAVNTDEIKAKREAMLARIEQLKKQKEQVGQQKVKDEFAVAEASEQEKSAQKKKDALVKESEKKTEEIERLQKELEVVDTQVVKADADVKKARDDFNAAQEKLAADIEREKQLEAEAKQKAEEAAEVERQIKEIEEQERKRLEAERLEREKFEREQREEAERTQRELMQLEALAEQQRQVEAAIKLEEEKKRKMEVAEKEAFSQQEKLANAETLQELRDLNRQLIEENRDLKLQLAEINRKLDLILAKLDYTPDPEKVDMSNATMQTLQEGKRLILRNIFFDYNEATLRPKSKYELNNLYSFLKENPSVKIVVSGHTDSRGNDSYNLRLSKDRAQAVVDYLVRNGIPSGRLSAVGYGETRPIARNENADGTDNPVGRQLNRRIEISLPEGRVQGVEVEEISVPKDARLNR